MEDTQLSTFGELIKSYRKQRQITQHELATRIGAHRNTIGIWERGDFLPDSKTVVLELAHHLHLDTQETRRLLEASMTALSPYWHMPYQRNPFFTGREGVLQQLHDALSHEHAAVLSQSYALSGLGGIGKTQTAIEYAYQYANDYAAVFWISAETTETLISAMITIATVLNLPEKQEKDQEKVVAAVTRWLSNHRDWLLIFDNVEDTALIKRFLPPARCGSLLYTSRQASLGLTAQALDLERMLPEEGTRFLLHRARLLDPGKALDQLATDDLLLAREIVTEMDGLPLALDQAGAYIDATRCSLSDYLRLFRSSHLHLLDERETYMDHPLSVARTFTLAFEQLEQSNALAAELLTACAFLAPEAIPETFFTEGALHLGPTFAAVGTDPFVFQSALKALLTYSLIQRNATNRTVTIHRLVQVVRKGHLTEAAQRLWLAQVTYAMCQLFPSDEKTQVDYLHMGEQLLPHALLCLTQSEQWGENETARVTLMIHVAAYLSRRARFDEAKVFYEQALRIGEDTFDSEHPLMADALHGLGTLCSRQGKYEQAKALYEQALSIRERVLGPEHPHVAVSLNNLAIVYREQGQYEQAKLLHERVLRIRERVLGPEHPHVAVSLNNLAGLHAQQGRYEEAESFYLRALRIWEQVLGPEHLEIAYPLNNLADLYTRWGRYKEAEPLYLRAWRIWEQGLGSDHPHVAHACYNLAYLYTQQGRYEKAEPLYLRALRTREQVLGSEHPYIAEVLDGLAQLYTEQGKYEQAEPLYQRALTIRQQQLDPQHPGIAELLQHFARFYQVQQQMIKALSLLQQALAIREQAFGSDHPQTRETRADCVLLLEEVKKEGSPSFQGKCGETA